MSDAIQRRLAAILSADVVGYSRLMGADQAGTLTALRRLRGTVFEPNIAAHNGHIVKRMGDGWLVEFASAADAVTCAISVQEGLADQETIKLRIGLHIGDIAHEDEDVYGDGVNIAARLQEIAEPDAIVISDIVRRSIDGNLAASFNELGKHDLKNIAEPVTAYGWGMTSTSTSAASPRTERPWIAVLPFENMSDDPEQEYFADGIAGDIIWALSRSNLLSVIGRGTSFHYRGKTVDARAVGRELNVRYVLDGTVRQAGDRVRVTAELIEAESGLKIWAERYDRDLTDIFAVQDEVTTMVTSAVSDEVTTAAALEAGARRPAELGAWDLTIKALWHIYRFNREDIVAARAVCQQALTRYGDNAFAHSLIAVSHVVDALYGWIPSPKEGLMAAAQAAQAAVVIDPNEEYAQAAMGIVLAFSGQQEAALRCFDHAIRLNPNFVNAIAGKGIALSTFGSENSEEAIEYLQKAIRLSPRDGAMCFWLGQAGFAEFWRQRYDEAIAYAEASRQANANYPSSYRLLAACYGLTGQQGKASEAVAALLRLQPNASVATMREILASYKDHVDELEVYFNGLAKAGLPD